MISETELDGISFVFNDGGELTRETIGRLIAAARHRTPSPAEPQTSFDDLLEVNEHTSNANLDLRRVLLMALQLAHSGNHDGKSESCPTCHVVAEARKIGIVFDAETGEPIG